jgi:outer membrane protein assembly factor BamE
MPQSSKPFSTFSRVVLLASLSVMAACGGYVPNIIAPYRPDIQQGNVIIESALNQLKPGMSQEQVRFILGSPLLLDPFHADRWDYVYRYQTGKGQVENSRITIVFKDGIFTETVGKPMPDSKR